MILTKPQTKIFSCESRFRVIVAGRRFGKTYLSALELISKAIAKPDQHCWYVAPTYKSAKEIAWDMIAEVIPDEYVEKRNETSLTLLLINGSKISLKGAEKPDNLRGRGIDFCILDEIADMRPNTWAEVLRPSLSDRGGSAMFIGTPKGRNHFYDLWGKGADNQEGWASFQFTTLDGGNVPKSELDAARGDLDERTFKQEYEAKFVNYSGIIYYNFVREDSVVRFEGELDHLHIGMDFNLDPMSAVVMLRRGDNLYAIDEVVMFGSNTDEMVAEIKQRYPSKKITIYPDPACRQRKTSAGGRTDLSILQNAGFEVRVKNAHTAVRDRVNAVNSRLKSSSGDRRLFIAPKCKKTIESLERQTYKEGTSQPDKSGYDHMNDALGYAVDYLFPIRKQHEAVKPQRWS